MCFCGSRNQQQLFPYTAVVFKVWSADPKGSTTSSQEILGYISVAAALKFT